VVSHPDGTRAGVRRGLGLALAAAAVLTPGHAAARSGADAIERHLSAAARAEQRGDWSRAAEAYAEAREALEAASMTREVVLVWTKIANCHEQRGDVERCLGAYERAAETLPRVDDDEFRRQTAPRLDTDRAHCLRLLGRWSEAEPLARRAVAAASEPGIEPLTLGAAAFRLAEVRLARGYVADALELLELSLAHHPADHPELDLVRARYAAALAYAGARRASEALYDAIEASPGAGDELRAWVLAERAYGDLLVDREEQAHERLAEARRLLGDRPAADELLVTLVTLDALALANMGRFEQAAARLGDELDGEVPRSSHRVIRAVTRARILAGLDDEGADAAFTDAVALARELDSPLLSYAASHLGRFRLDGRGDARGALEPLRLAVDELERALRRGPGLDALERQVRHAGLLRRYDPYSGLVRAWLHLGEREEAASVVEAARARGLSALLERATPVVASARPLDDVRGVLRSGEALLYYLVDGLECWAVLVPPPGRAVSAFSLREADGTPLSEPRLAALATSYRDALLGALGGGAVRGRALGSGARAGASAAPGAPAPFERFVPPRLWDAVRGLDTLYLVPHDALAQLPFEALVVDTGAPSPAYWADAGPDLAYLPSGAALVWAHARRAELDAAPDAETVLVVADPATPLEGLARLPGARREAAAVETLLRDDARLRPHVLAAAAATPRATLERARDARVLHVAAHQVVHPTRGLGALALAGSDGLLGFDTLVSTWRGALARCELVVLSACGSALGTQVADEEVLTLPWAFHAAGAPAVMASLWPVGDEATAELMEAFYAGLAAGERPGPTLLARARRTVRERWPQPYHWAPFVWYGAAR